MSLASLPSELYSAILSHVDDEHVQGTILALTRALPRAPIPLENLFARICLRHSSQVVQLHRRLRGQKEDACYVREFRLESWTADAQVVINLLALLDNLASLTLFVGPNFAPEDLLEVFGDHREELQHLSLRFRPYVLKANYYQFLKGAYFDSTLSALSRWPSSSLETLSIVQDPHVGQVHFAQPLVFFTFQPLAALSTSPVSAHISALRLRIPARDVVPFIAAAPRAFPALTALDLSTGNIKDAQLARLLTRFSRVQHVRLDACSLITAREGVVGPAVAAGAADSEWATLGRSCALAGARRAKEREKALKAWREALDAAVGPAHAQDAQPQRSRARAGRKGLATAAISLRGATGFVPVVLTPAAPVPSSSTPSNMLPHEALQKIRVVPAPPSLLTLCTTASTPAPALVDAPAAEAGAGEAPGAALGADTAAAAARRSAARAEFARGWAEGITTLRAMWLRLRTSQQNGTVRVMALSEDGSMGAQGEGIDGLVDLEDWTELDKAEWPCAVLCLAGEGSAEGAVHVEGCGHDVTRDMWRSDNLV
ncbi:hypothetical protein M0805_002537 [Coniferiporia weirii]|nr:hypothetical protein M0805_002537 [Coniferiporia weirii]